MNVPAGSFMPIFTLGMACGQLYCILLLRMLGAMNLPWSVCDMIQFRGIYSMVGATALTASVTRTVSVAVIVLEINGHHAHMIPVILASLTGYIISEFIYPIGFFEMIFELKGLKAMIIQKNSILVREALAYDERFNQFDYLTLEMSQEQIEAVLIRILAKQNGVEEEQINLATVIFERDDLFLAVVDSDQEMTLLFLVQVK
jgi:hypothetical protein